MKLVIKLSLKWETYCGIWWKDIKWKRMKRSCKETCGYEIEEDKWLL